MNPLDKIPLDKSHHVIGGSIVATVAACLAIYLGHPKLAWQVAIVLPLIGGVAKELADYAANLKAAKAGQPAPHGVEFLDALATVLGGVPVALPLFLNWR